jgi:cytochrome P450
MRRLMPTPFLKLPEFLREGAARYGTLVSFATWWRRFVLVNDPAFVRDVLVTHQHAFRKSVGTASLGLLLGQGLLTSEEPFHRKMRRIVQPAFHRERIASYVETMNEFAGAFVERIEPGAPFDLHAAATELTLRIASTTLFGIDAGDDARDVSEAMHELMEIFPYVAGPIGELRRKFGLAKNERFDRARDTLDRIVYGIIARRRKDPSDRGDVLSMLLAATDAETGEAMTDTQVRDEALTLFIAGHETTATALVWTFYLLARHADVDARLASAVRDGDAEFVRRVFQESMRLYPPAWIFAREAMRDVTLSDGRTIAGGTTVFVAPLVLHHTPALYPDPERFDPDRWLDDAERDPFSYVPFGGGARRCIGEAFAWAEGVAVVSKIAAAYRLELVSEREVEPAAMVTLRPSGPVMVRAVPR